MSAFAHFAGKGKGLGALDDMDMKNPQRFTSAQGRGAIVRIIKIFQHHRDTGQTRADHLFNALFPMGSEQRVQGPDHDVGVQG